MRESRTIIKPGHVHNSPTMAPGRLIDSPTKDEPTSVNVLRSGILQSIRPSSIQCGDVLCDRAGNPLRKRKS